MARYLAFCWSAADLAAETQARLRTMRAALEADAWALVHEHEGLWVFSSRDRPIRVEVIGPNQGVLIGDLFAASPAQGAASAASDIAVAEDMGGVGARLLRTFWGRYVALLTFGEAVGVLRDPGGGLDCLVWRRAGVTIAASELPEPVLATFAPPLAIDWSRIAGFAADPISLLNDPALDGVWTVPAGALMTLGSCGRRTDLIWRPSAFARRRPAGEEISGAALVRAVDHCVFAWAERYPNLVAEVSGGLDSSIVTSCLVRAAKAKVGEWVNDYFEGGGDERLYARAVARRFDLDLSEVAKRLEPFEPERLEEVAEGPRPTFNSADVLYDQDMAQRCARVGADAQITGQGGDALFFQTATPLVAADHLARLGVRALGSAFLWEVAAWTRRSVWSVAREAALGGWSRARSPFRAPDFVSGRARRIAAGAPPHPWLADLSGSPPAKRLHGQTLLYSQLFFGDCRRSRQAELIHPLLSQPLLELCLSIPVDDLVRGGQDRALARRAFAARLPKSVIERRSKGDLTAYYGRRLALGLSALRAYLLDGRLVGAGVLDYRRLDAGLTEAALMGQGGYADVMDMVAIEAWVRVWERRISRLSRVR